MYFTTCILNDAEVLNSFPEFDIEEIGKLLSNNFFKLNIFDRKYTLPAKTAEFYLFKNCPI